MIRSDSGEITKRILLGTVLLIALLAAGDLYFKTTAAARSGISTSAIGNGLLFLAVIVMLLFAAAYLFSRGFREQLEAHLEPWIHEKEVIWGILLIGLLLVYEFFQDILFLGDDMAPVHYLGYRNILSDYFSIVILLLAFGILMVVYACLQAGDQILGVIRSYLNQKTLMIFAVLGSILLFLNWFDYGRIVFGQEITSNGSLNAPLLGIQVSGFLLVYISLRWIFARLISRWPILDRILNNETAVMLVIWLGAFVLWSYTPLGPNSFLDPPRPPNNTLYPASDSLIYEIDAFEINSGYGFDQEKTQQHPLYPLWLALLHRIAGPEYQDIIPLQVLVLSLTPVFLYLLTSRLHSRGSGLLVSSLYIIKERNELFLSEHITSLNSKVVMTEPLVTLLVIIFLWLVLKWFESPKQRYYLVLVAGVVISLAFQVRTEVILMVPVAAAFGIWIHKDQLKKLLLGLGSLLMVIVVMLVPWSIRNKQVIGSIGIDNLTLLVNSAEIVLERILPGEMDDVGPSQENKPTIDQNQDSESAGGDIAARESEPKQYTRADGFPDHLADNIKGSFLYLPNGHQPLLTVMSAVDLVFPATRAIDLEGDSLTERYLERYVRSLPYWWRDWDGHLVSRSVLPVLITALVISLGLAQIQGWKFKYAAMMLAVLAVHGAINAFVGYAGGRFILAVHWIPLVFYGIGLHHLVDVPGPVREPVEKKVEDNFPEVDQIEPVLHQRRKISLAVLVVLLSSLILPAAEWFVDPVYTSDTLEETSAGIAGNLERIPAAAGLEELGFQAVVAQGRAIYPRFFQAGEEMEDDRKGILPDPSYNRVEFYLVGTSNTWAALPVIESLDYLPHASDVLLVGVKVNEQRDASGERVFGEYIKIAKLFLLDENKQVIREYSCAGEACSLDQ